MVREAPLTEGLEGRHVLVTGATGYVASRLIPELLRSSAAVRATSRSPEALADRFPKVEIVPSDLQEPPSLDRALEGIEVAYYLVHSMDAKDFEERDRSAARNFLAAAQRAGIGRIIYLSGLGRKDDRLSKHLLSRHEVGRILASGSIPVTEIRAAIVIGSGSSAFDMLRYLTERLPVMIAPRWLATRIQPISEDDLVAYLVAAGIEAEPGGVVEVGGSDVVTYRQMIHGYARLRRLRRMVIGIPLLTPRLSSYWVQLMTPVATSVSRPLIDGLQNEVIVTNDSALSRYPDVMPVRYLTAAADALDRQTELMTEELSDGIEIPGTRVGFVTDEQRLEFRGDPEQVAAALAGFGGRAWYPMRWAWVIRRWLDRLSGGGDLSWKRPDGPLVRGSLVDWWEVDNVEATALVLRALMKTPGEAWLSFRAESDADKVTLVQTAAFRPRGLLGRFYWWGLWPIHRPIFGSMAKRLAKRMSAGTTSA